MLRAAAGRRSLQWSRSSRWVRAVRLRRETNGVERNGGPEGAPRVLIEMRSAASSRGCTGLGGDRGENDFVGGGKRVGVR